MCLSAPDRTAIKRNPILMARCLACRVAALVLVHRPNKAVATAGIEVLIGAGAVRRQATFAHAAAQSVSTSHYSL
jgi:hypothetical protein